MAEKSTNAMSEHTPDSLTDCQRQIEAAVAELRAALAENEALTAPTPEQRESSEANVCLASRSACFDFYTWLVLHRQVDEAAERDLDGLLRRALAVMEPGRFKKSVQARYVDFKRECQHVRSGSSSNFDPSPELASSIEIRN